MPEGKSDIYKARLIEVPGEHISRTNPAEKVPGRLWQVNSLGSVVDGGKNNIEDGEQLHPEPHH